MQESISGCRRRTQEQWTTTKILDEFSLNDRTFVKHHLFNQVWWLEITAPMHNKNSTVYICFRSYQLLALPFCHAWRQTSTSKWLPDVYKNFLGRRFVAQLTENSTFLRIDTDKVMEMSLNKDIKVITFLVTNKFNWWKGCFVCMFSSVKHKIIYK